MGWIQSVQLSEELSVRWLDYKQRHPGVNFNQVCREAIERLMDEENEEGLCATDAPTSTIR